MSEAKPCESWVEIDVHSRNKIHKSYYLHFKADIKNKLINYYKHDYPNIPLSIVIFSDLIRTFVIWQLTAWKSSNSS